MDLTAFCSHAAELVTARKVLKVFCNKAGAVDEVAGGTRGKDPTGGLLQRTRQR